jgi:hypothetical protein
VEDGTKENKMDKPVFPGIKLSMTLLEMFSCLDGLIDILDEELREDERFDEVCETLHCFKQTADRTVSLFNRIYMKIADENHITVLLDTEDIELVKDNKEFTDQILGHEDQ